MYISLYRRYRPQTFSDMVGQSAAVGVLMESLRGGSLGHAYLFSGPRGCGKTSAARLVAKSLDCQGKKDGCEPCGLCESCRAIASGEHLDVIEIDGASNRGIGEIRDLKSHVNLKPLSAAYKVYIIDEVHMLTEQAFNALLKTLEEPPSNVVFLLATTEPHKVPVTIRSRCQHIPFHRITIADTVSRLKYVCAQENIEAEEEAVWELARQADGALRDALSLTEQAVALGRGKLSLASVKELTGGSSRTELEKWVTLTRTSPMEGAAALHSIMARGVSPERLCESLFALFRDLWMYSLWGESSFDALETSPEERAYLASEARHWEANKLKAVCELCNSLMPRAHYGMKGDIFSGVIIMELKGITDGEKNLAGTGAGRERNLTRQQASGADGTVSSAPFQKQITGAALPAPEQQTPAGKEAREASSAGGEELFWKLASLIEEDKRLEIASALLNAAVVRGAEGAEAEFESEMPARSFLSAAQNKKALREAAAALWKIERQDISSAEETREARPSPERDTGQAERKPRQREESGPQQAALPALSDILRKAGAELLYVRSAGADEEETEGGNE